MKKHIGYIILSCIILVLAGALVFLLCQNGSSSGEAVAAKPTDSPVKVYELEDIFNNPMLNFSRSGSYVLMSGTGVFNLSFMDAYLPITKLSQANNDLVYTVYDVQENGIGYNMYVFFKRGKDYEGKTAGQITEDNFVTSPEKWPITGQILFMNKTLSFADFSSLQVGDSVERAEAIDPIVSIAKKEKSSSVTYFHTNHLLTDGSLLLVFNRNSIDEDFSLASIEYDENFIFYDEELRIRAADYASK